MWLPLATSEGVSVIGVMLVVGGIFLFVILLGELTHHLAHRRAERRQAQRARY
jgi:hypothetical protein